MNLLKNDTKKKESKLKTIFECDTCGKKFTKNLRLEIHIRTHVKII